MIIAENFTAGQGLTFQKILMKLQIALEDTFLEIARMVTDKPVVLLIDRGLLDGSAFVSKDEWQCLMDDMNMSVVNMRENRYDAVLHLVTAADGAEKFYSSESNPNRYDTIETSR